MVISNHFLYKDLVHHPIEDIPQERHFEDVFPFPKVGYVTSLEGTFSNIVWFFILYRSFQLCFLQKTSMDLRQGYELYTTNPGEYRWLEKARGCGGPSLGINMLNKEFGGNQPMHPRSRWDSNGEL